jgi:ATP sulfurylase
MGHSVDRLTSMLIRTSKWYLLSSYWELKVTGYAPCAQDQWQLHALHVTRNPWHLAHTGLQWRRQA